ncbi:MAG: MFS transporter [Streptosporangiales bacterium]|nr:MFS transporter [Streptosporangiales bacterium]
MTAPAHGDAVPARPRRLRRVVAAAVVGTALEWYDFFIYGTASALVFGKLFFPSSDPAIGVLLGFATFGVGFVFRPVGGLLFGHLGDRIGRRSTLVITTLVMGLSTGIIGLLPTYASIGVVAPVLLTLLRICQGLGAGAEFGGASTLLSEHAPQRRRGFFASFAQLGVQIGLVMGTLAFLLVGLLPEETVLAGAWRIPFLVSFVLIAVSVYVRLRVDESPVFEAMVKTRRVVKLPIRDALKRYPRSFLVGVGAHVCDTAAIYLYATFSVAYVTNELGLPSWVTLTGIIIFDVFVISLQPVFGALSDRIGRRPINIFSVVFTGLFAYPFFMLVNTAEPVLIWLALVIAAVVGWAPMIAVQPAFYAELFGARVRYTGFAASRELGAAVAGFSPLIATALLQLGGPWLVPVVLVVAAAVSFVAFMFSRETRDVDITAYDITEPTGTPTASGTAVSGG